MQLWVLAFTLILVRTGSFVAVLPMFGRRQVPRTVKIGLILALTALWFVRYGLAPSATLLQNGANVHWLGFALAVVREVIFGAVLGYAFGLFLLPARIAGSYIGQEMGLTFAAISDPAAGTSANVVSELFEALAILLFFSLDVHHVLFATLHFTFQRFPIGTPLSDLPMLPLVRGVAEAHEWGLMLAAPLGICLFASVIVLTLLMRATPQFNLFSVGLSLRLAFGFLGALVFLPDMIVFMTRIFQQLSGFAHNLVFSS